MLPAMDGLSLLKAMRAADVDTPVLMLSALGSTDDRVSGLTAGADDYLGKLFSFAELLARVQAWSAAVPARPATRTPRSAAASLSLTG